MHPPAFNNPSQVAQNWHSSYMHYAALSAASPQQLAAYQQLIAQRQQLFAKAQTAHQQQLLMQGHVGGHAYHHRQLEPNSLHTGTAVATAATTLSAGHGMSLGQAVTTSVGQVVSSASGSVFRLPEQSSVTSNGVQSTATLEQTQKAVQRLKLK